MRKSYVFSITLLLNFLGLCGESITQNEVLSYVDSVHALLQSRYAPAQLKSDYYEWSLSRETAALKKKILEKQSLTVKEFQTLFLQYLYSTKDYHVGGSFYSTEYAYLPFKVKRLGNSYYITYVDRSKLGVFNIGDEVVKFGGQSPDEIVQELKKLYTPMSHEESDQSIAEIYLTFRSGAGGLVVPRGPIEIAVKDAGTKELNNYQIIWTYNPEKIQDMKIPKALSSSLPKWMSPERMKFDRAAPLLKNHFSFCSEEGEKPMDLDPNEIGAKKSFLPCLGNVVWETTGATTFHAYLYTDSNDKMIGYIRIPHYMLDEDDLQEFEEIMEVMNGSADLLVIDQLNNPGGNLFSLYTIASMLTDKSLATPKEHILLSQEEVMEAHAMLDLLDLIQTTDDAKAILGETFYGSEVNYHMAQFMKEYFRFNIEQWRQGKVYTDLTHIYGIDFVNPHPRVRFTKPIVLLINGLDFSCGDFFPAIMKDNKRATLVGTRTAGAGGYVLPHYISNRLGVAQITLTGSLGIRSTGKPIENLGVSPDVVNELMPSDIHTGYQNYIQNITEVIERKLKESPGT